jgi:two-component system sensor histidine kinase GlrK
MRFLRPRSIVSLILVGFAAVLAPFVAAVLTAVTQVDRFAVESRTAVLNALSATEDSRSMVEQIQEMQRALGQYALRESDPAFFEIYLDRRSQFRAALANLMALELEGLEAESLRSLADEEAALFERVRRSDQSVPDGDWQSAIDSFAPLAELSRGLLEENDARVQESANELNARAESLQRTLLVIVATAAPVTAALVVIFTLLITRPMRELGGAIRRLGARSLDQPISVHGPEDIEGLAAELEGLRLRINALEEQKATFLQHISHELKTPLATIREGSELLTESLGSDRSEDAEIARLLKQNGLYLQRLIEDLLQFAKTQELALDLEFEAAVDLSRVIGDSLAALSVVIDSKGIAVESELGQVSARCDAAKIRTVVDNLLTNAIKYTPERGRIEIRLSAEADKARIDVSDSGPGVDESDRERIFEPFRQGSAEYESSVKGTGLGLSIAREYVEAHGGSIDLVETPRGAHFRVQLPIAGPAAAAA